MLAFSWGPREHPRAALGSGRPIAAGSLDDEAVPGDVLGEDVAVDELQEVVGATRLIPLPESRLPPNGWRATIAPVIGRFT